MMREWRRLYRARGFAPFGVLLVVLLATLIVVDQIAERWEEAVQRRDDLQQRLGVMRAVSERGRQIDAALESARGRVTAVSSRVVTAPDARAAGELLGQGAERWLASVGAKVDRRSAVESASAAGPGVAAADVVARITPRQLLRILGDWQQAPLAMRLVRLELTVDNPDSPTSLDALFRVEGVYQRPATDAARVPSEPRSARRQDAK